MQTIPLQTVQIVFYIIAFILLALASIADIKTMQIPNWITNSFVASCGLYLMLLVTAHPSKMPLSNLTGAFIVALPMFLFALFKEGSVGGADIRIVFGLGLMVGVCSILRLFLFSTVIAAIVTAATLLCYSQKLTCVAKIPYVPFLLAGFTVETVLGLIA